MKMAKAYIAKSIAAVSAVVFSLCLNAAAYDVISESEAATLGGATGGDEIRKISNSDGSYDIVHIYKTVGINATFTVPAENKIFKNSGRFLIVGGGGSGSANCGAGGGAGGLVYKDKITLSAGSAAIKVGAGGVSVMGNARGANGQDTTLSYGGVEYIAYGGGTAGLWHDENGNNGGSGGGACGNNGTVGSATQPGSATGGFGNSGGKGYSDNIGGGGGGAGGAGKPATAQSGGAGGAGLEYDISGEALYYAAGGGGGNVNGAPGGMGGSGIGGNGTGQRDTTAPAGVDGTGSGGGGGAGGGGTSYGGAGGSGIVIVRYTISGEKSTYGFNSTHKIVEGEDVYIFSDTSNLGELVITKSIIADILVVGGGGAGANPAGSNGNMGGAGGGGAGGMIEKAGVVLSPGSYTFEVGRGGVNQTTAKGDGADGEPSIIKFNGSVLIEALGGGGGGMNEKGRSGGSGGGGSSAYVSSKVVAKEGGQATQPTSVYGGYGNAGGLSNEKQVGGGGGGAGGAGGNVSAGASLTANKAGAGGAGRISSITGEAVYYAGGGAGGSRGGVEGATGGSEIGGNGGYSKASATSGKDGTGSGGGGGKLNDKGGSGGSGIIIIRVKSILPPKPVKTMQFTYDGNEHLHYDAQEGVIIKKGEETVEKIAVKDVGIHTYTVSLAEGYIWDDGTDESPITVTITVSAPTISVDTIALGGWQLGVEPQLPRVKTSPIQLESSDYKVLYSDSKTGPWSEEVPSEQGDYFVTIEIFSSPNYNIPDSSQIPVVPFSIWQWDGTEAYLDSLGYHAKITIDYAGLTEESLADFPLLVKISEDSISGFYYKHANPDGSDLRFIDSDGNILAHEIDTWNPEGESLIWVKVPEFKNGTEVTFCWGELVGKTVPAAIDPKTIWSSYAGVWHMNDAVNALDGIAGRFNETALVEVDGILGKAHGKTAAGNNGPILTVNTSSMPAINALANSDTFTVSCWVCLNTDRADSAVLFSRKISDASDAWAALFNNTADNTGLRIWLNGNKDHYLTYRNFTFAKGTWYRIETTFGKTGKEYSIWIDGERKTSGNVPSIAALSHGSEALVIGGLPDSARTINGNMDEVRIIAGSPSQAWRKAEYDQVKNTVYQITPTRILPGAIFKNRWIKKPTINITTWEAGASGIVANGGEAVYGSSYYHFDPGVGKGFTNTIPPNGGSYMFTGRVDAKKPGKEDYGWEALVSDGVTIFVTASSPYQDLSGVSGNMTLSGRVLLANDHGDGQGAIRGQDYSLTETNTTTGTFWRRNDGDANGARPYLSPATINELLSTSPILELCGAKTLWYCEDVKVGNYYPKTQAIGSSLNFLPWSSEAKPNGANIESSHLFLRNSSTAAIYSPCYTNGIGTIYFDAVNLETSSDSTNTTIVVEICTNTIYGASIPTDKNIIDWQDNKIETDELGNQKVIPGYTNRFAYAQWHAVELHPLIKKGTDNFVPMNPTKELPLDIAIGKSSDNFYRVYAKIDYTGPIRFRIRRGAAKESDGVDVRMIIVDNIIASYPAMRADLSAYGTFDPLKGGKQILGQAAAWETPFPSINDEVVPRAKITYRLNDSVANADPAKFVSTARMHYRWRYLNQQHGEWNVAGLDPYNDFKGDRPLELPKGLVGDVEYWFETTLNAPFYEYVDYSGTGLGLGGFYTENFAVVTNRAPTTIIQQSTGTDWFVRLREGKSNYEAVNLIVATEIKEYTGTQFVTNTVEMELVGDGVWRGCYQTKAAIPAGLKYRFEAFNKQTPGDTEYTYSTNYWKASENWTALPVNDVMAEATADDWATIPCDGLTGYVLFQIDDSTKVVTIVHADYQNFNGWNDANRMDKYFVGSSTEDESKVGVSPKAKETENDFNTWADLPVSNDAWVEQFNGLLVPGKFELHKPFDAATTLNNWNSGQGMMVHSQYKGSDDQKLNQDYALQMQGNGVGFVTLRKSSVQPRGLESVTFKARVAQSIDFWKDFAYYDAPAKAKMTNYTFVAPANFDTNNNNDFSGNATISLIAHFDPMNGCYELRVEKQRENRRNLEISLYRWSYDNEYVMTAKKLVSENWSVNNLDWPQTSSRTTSGFMPLYISVSNESNRVMISAGCMKTSGGVNNTYEKDKISGKEFQTLRYEDRSDERIKGGTYGVISSNCKGTFITPKYFTKPTDTIVADPQNAANKIVNFEGTIVECSTNQISVGEWVIPPGRMESGVLSTTGGQNRGIWGIVPSQKVNIWTADVDGDNWSEKPLATVDISSFKYADKVVTVYENKNCAVKISTGGSRNGIRTDVVIDNITLKQFRGANWDDSDVKVAVPALQIDNINNNYTNFVISSCWIKDKSILMSARRTQPGGICAIRAPLFDGIDNRGRGLGMFSFNYKNAQRNVNLLLQVATNVTYTSLASTEKNYSLWTTVTNFNFSTLSDSMLRSGTCSCYIGMHGVQGVIRLIMDPNVVDSVQGVTDITKFGDIYIDDVFARDEPALDLSSWWGWNLRTLGGAVDDENRMILYDLTHDLSKMGMSLALNNSVTDQTLPRDREEYKQNMPFVQTPTFTSNVVGEVSFRARKYDADDSQPAQVTLYGSLTGKPDDTWKRLKAFVVSNNTYSTFSFKTDRNEAYSAFRLGVSGVAGVTATNADNRAPEGYDSPVRVLIDEVLVSEAIRASMAFRNVGAFRSGLDKTDYVPNVPSASEQPLCNESWGVQCEVFPTQLAEEINFDRAPTVKLYWYPSDSPWGFENWRDNPATKSGYLARATGTNLIYRSSYISAPDSVVQPEGTPYMTPGTTVQYELEVVYYLKGSGVPVTNYLSSAGTWFNPPWYKSFNKNAGKRNMTAYTVLDTVAPQWAWINEINVFGNMDKMGKNTDTDYQFVEVAVPADANISGWNIRFLEALSDKQILTNVVATFGSDNISSTKKDLIGMASNMVYRVVSNKASLESGRLKLDDGTTDGAWSIRNKGVAQMVTGELDWREPFAVQLVRGSGIVEHEVVLVGTNSFPETSMWYGEFHPTNLVARLERNMPGADFIYIGDDDRGSPNSLSVLSSRGETSNHWSNAVSCTPGRVNNGQVILGQPPTPNGSSIRIFATLDSSFGHITQSIGDVVNTNANLIIVIDKGNPTGTNITYTVDPWYELAGVTTNGAPARYEGVAKRVYKVNVAAGASNDVTVVAGAKIADSLVNEFGLGPDNNYRDAVMDWLEKGVDANNKKWANPESGEIKLAQYCSLSGNVVTNLTLTQMYWLDMDPTVGDLALVGGMVKAPQTILRSAGIGSSELDAGYESNLKMAVKMYITNRTDDVDSKYYNKPAWSPYILRGRGKGETSWTYAQSSSQSWSNVTFKITGFLATAQVGHVPSNKESWVPLRWFVFNKDSFDANHISHIEIKDPFGTDTPGYSAGWYDWKKNNGETPVFFGWALDTRLRPFPVEVLKETNYYE